MKSRALMVVGVAGTGKTTLASILSNLLGIAFIDLPQYVRERMLYEGLEEGDMIIDLAKVSSSLGAEIRRRGDAVVASVYPFKPRSVEVEMAIILRKRPDKLLRILEERGYGPQKIAANLEAELIDLPLTQSIDRYGKNKVVQLNVTDVDLRILSERIVDKIRSRRLRDLHEEVDWTLELERIGKLDEILFYISRHKTF